MKLIFSAELAQVEAAAAIAARQRASGGITLAERDDAVDLLPAHCMTEYRLVGTNPIVLDRAIRLTQNHRLRGYDAVHLATALIVNERWRRRSAALPMGSGLVSALSWAPLCLICPRVISWMEL